MTPVVNGVGIFSSPVTVKVEYLLGATEVWIDYIQLAAKSGTERSTWGSIKSLYR